MVNYSKAQQVIEDAKLKYEKSPEQLKEEKWFEQVKNPRTNEFFQWHDLKQVEIEPPDEIAAKRRYPVKTVNSIYRVQSLDGKEWLMSRQTWTALDRNGNGLSKSFDDMETWLKPIIKYETRPEDPKDRFSKMIRKAVGVGLEVKIYEKAFTPKALDDLYAMRSPSCSLVLLKVNEYGQKTGNPYIIEKYADFRDRAFDDLYGWASTPRQASQTKIGQQEANEKNKQYQ